MTPDNAGRKIGFIGAGTLGSGLALALHRAGYDVCAVSSLNLRSAEELAARINGCQPLATNQEVCDSAGLVFITTPDAAITPVAASLKWTPGQEVLHCCGAVGRELLQPAADQGAKTGAIHPFQTFGAISDADEAALRLSGVTFAVSGDDSLQPFLARLAEDLGGRAVTMDDSFRALYHVSAILSCGYLVTLLQAAAEIWRTGGFSFEDGLQAVSAISRATLDNVARVGPQASVTGPLVRGDVAVVRQHLEALKDGNPHLLRLYAELTELSRPLARARGLTPEGEAALAHTLAELVVQPD